MSITIKDIARMANVSMTTVSKIINSKDKEISQATRERVNQIIREHNYTPNKIAQSMITKKTKTIGLVIPDVRNPFFTELARGAEDVANEHGYSVIFCNSDDNMQKEVTYINMLVEKMVDGILLAPAATREEKIESEINIRLPIITMDREAAIQGIKGHVKIDNIKGAYDAVHYLVGLGHEEIVLFSGPVNNQTSMDRLEGYRKALEDNGLKFREDRWFAGDFKGKWTAEVVRSLMRDSVSFTALFCANDLIAIEAIKELQKCGIRIPEQVSVVGFDDIPFSSMVSPELTTVRQPSYEIGAKAAEMLVGHLKKSGKLPSPITLMPELTIRDSTRAILRSGGG
ncbi:LacI family DNA-binding transcriptional regulator [Cohnella silvisoli]|uniref:LacI family DNA-binding transcriptional regulator n=1 Tax=Cohnella silvisoli TaxID=2873699 RepID=A0ABV1KW45_9BACL|nr:LacI family DNA-binding transcriptional regulator [Cohnella silvisoli]MCD9023597.1 LacI family transcriptional regulator [Cohnella silvisoli]